MADIQTTPPSEATVVTLPVEKAVDAFMHDDLARSGLTVGEIGATLEKSEFGGAVGYRIPYYLPDGMPHPKMYRVRLAAPVPGGGKYSQPPKAVFEEGAYPYLPPAAADPSVTRDANNPPLIVEGEKKALAAIKFLRRAAYGIGGCWNWAAPRTDPLAPHELHPELRARFRDGEAVDVVFDGDILTNPNVRLAAGTLRLRLIEAGLQPRFVILPNTRRGKCGLDDFLVDCHARGLSVLGEFERLPRVSGAKFEAHPRDLWAVAGLALHHARMVPFTHPVNAARLLERLPRLQGFLRYNNVLMRWELFDPDDPTTEPVTDPDAIMSELHRQFYDVADVPAMPQSSIDLALNGHALTAGYSPVAEYLERCAARWDKVPRLDTFFVRALRITDTPYHRAVSVAFFLQAVDRAMNPGCKADYMLILSGRGGVGKTTLVRAIAGNPDWAKEWAGALDTKDALMALGTGWIVELSETVSVNATSSDALKSVITRQVDAFRPPYGKATKQVPRRTVMVGTTNDTAVLRYEAGTGNRRFLVLDLGDNVADLALVHKEIDAVWGEALLRLRSGERYWEGLEKLSAAAVEQHTAPDPWIEVLEDYVSTPANLITVTTANGARLFVPSSSLREVALQIPNAQLHPGINKRLHRAMEGVGDKLWRPQKALVNGRLTRGFAHPLTSGVDDEEGTTE